MKSRIWVLFVVLAGLCWGVYVPFIAAGGIDLGNGFAAFLCVGVAYFLIAILLPLGILAARGGRPQWSAAGITFATLAGAAGALGALCVTFAAGVFHGPRLYVAPVIFALAPVINTLVSLFWHPDEGSLKIGPPREKPHWTLYVGILLAALGAGVVLLAKELTEAQARDAEAAAAKAEAAGEPKPGEESKPAEKPKSQPEANPIYLLFVILAGLCWGTYVPLIAHGGKTLKSSYASLLCVGAAYFLIAVVFPAILFAVQGKFPDFFTVGRNFNGSLLATLAGAAGAVGALCVIFATFEFKGPRLYVAPVIFALAPVINTVVSLFWHPNNNPADPWVVGPPAVLPHWSLYVGIVLAGLGAGMVLYAKELTEARHAPARPGVAPLPTAASEPVKP